MDKVVALCKRRGFIFAASDIFCMTSKRCPFSQRYS